MEEAVIKAIASAGPFAVLFFWALWDKSSLIKQVMNDSKNREERLMEEKRKSDNKSTEREEKLMACLGDLSLVRKDVDEVKDDVGEMKQDIKILKDRGK